MLDATEDGNDERLASSRKKGFPEAVKADVSNRMVYKLVKVGDDGSVLAATEDEILQSLVEGSDNGLSSYDSEGSGVIGDDKNEEGSDFVLSDEDDSRRRANIIPIQDLAVERQRLKAQIEVLDCILMKVDLEEKKRLFAKKIVAESVGCREGNPSSYLNAGDRCGDYKRQRRPNPKYFDCNARDDSLMVLPLGSTSGDTMPRPLSSRKPHKNIVVVSPKVPTGWGSHHSSGRTTALLRSKAIVSQKSFIQTLNNVVSTCPVLNFISKEDNTISLENLSIRELHEAFCSTYGRETSVKDKQWLKRQISAGWMRQQDVVIKSNSHQQVQNKLKARLECVTQAEQPLPFVASLNVGDTKKSTTNETHLQKENDVEHFRDAFRNRLRSGCFQQRMTTSAIPSRGGSFGILTTGSLNGSSVPNGQTAIYGEVVNNSEVIEGKRQRKPNRRYIEDEAHVDSGFVPIHDTRSFYGEIEGIGLNSTTNYSWRTVETNGSSSIIGLHGTVRGPNLPNISNKKILPIQRPKLISSGMKRKVGGRATKLVKMAHTIARARRHDVEVAICKAKFHLPATLDIITDSIPDINREVGDRTSNVLPIMQFDPLAIMQPLVLDIRGNNEQLIVTVPTTNGGTRRKHHRPWTLREVMTLVEGVARCGGGKWANIKKLAFSTVGYRTAVDLKDKWRNLLRASRAQPHPTKQGERRKQFTTSIPTPVLARVRELASLPNQIPLGTISVSSTSHSGQIVHQK